MRKQLFLLLLPVLLLSSCVKETPEPLYTPEKPDPENRKVVRTTEYEGIGYELYNDGTCEIISANSSAYNGSSLNLPHQFDECEVVAIQDGVFANGSFTHVAFPRSLKSIGKGAFERTQITELVLPETLTQLGEEAFSSCARLEKLTVSGNLKIIPTGAFYGCRNLQEITFQKGVEEIGEEAFGDLPNLKSLVLPEGLLKIGPFAFWRCGAEGFTVSLPESVEEIGKSAFDNTPWLENLTEEWVMAGKGVLLRYNGTSAEVTLPKNVSYLSNAFDRSPVVTLTLPDDLKGIASGALEDSNIETVHFKGENQEVKKELER